MKMITLAILGAALVVPGSALVTTTAAQDKAPLAIQFPQPTLKGTPEDLPTGPHIEPPSDKPPKPLMVPSDVKNVALNKPVTSPAQVITGELKQITDGNKEAFDDQVVEMKKGLQYIQVDLEKEYQIFAIAIWNDHRYVQAYRRIIIQLADDAEFTKNVRTLFNNDYENKAGFGVGTDREYFENRYGRTIDGKGEKARYVRWYSNGSNASALNNRQEIEVYGK
ncbi:MAG: hypothetical protein WCO56_11925 [Verrucomicrobiota bacterium]